MPSTCPTITRGPAQLTVRSGERGLFVVLRFPTVSHRVRRCPTRHLAASLGGTRMGVVSYRRLLLDGNACLAIGVGRGAPSTRRTRTGKDCIAHGSSYTLAS